MMEYRRVISYLYEYHGRTQGKNVGFVRLEVRNGQCRLRIFLKGDSHIWRERWVGFKP